MLAANNEDKLQKLLAHVPEGAIKTWGQLEALTKLSDCPIYMLVIESPDNNPVLQFKHSTELKVMDDAVFYMTTRERLCQRDYLNKGCLPTYMIFDNYFHLKAFELKLKTVGYVVHYRKF
jgi:hypothetical protein